MTILSTSISVSEITETSGSVKRDQGQHRGSDLRHRRRRHRSVRSLYVGAASRYEEIRGAHPLMAASAGSKNFCAPGRATRRFWARGHAPFRISDGMSY
jgi:hypothetical protein